MVGSFLSPLSNVKMRLDSPVAFPLKVWKVSPVVSVVAIAFGCEFGCRPGDTGLGSLGSMPWQAAWEELDDGRLLAVLRQTWLQPCGCVGMKGVETVVLILYRRGHWTLVCFVCACAPIPHRTAVVERNSALPDQDPVLALFGCLLGRHKTRYWMQSLGVGVCVAAGENPGKDVANRRKVGWLAV